MSTRWWIEIEQSSLVWFSEQVSGSLPSWLGLVCSLQVVNVTVVARCLRSSTINGFVALLSMLL